MNKKFKNRNRGLVTFGIVALSAVALTASGFAAWVISGADSKEATGNIQVDTVENNNHTLAVTLSNENIVFGSVSEGASWLTNTDTNMAESLSTTASITVSNVTSDPTADISKILSVPTIKITKTIGEVVTDVTATNYNIIADGSATDAGLKETANEAMDGLVGKLPTFTTASYTGAKYNDSAKTLTCSLTVTFTWGNLFNHKNPRTYYKDSTAAQKGAEAQSRLTALHNALNGCKYVITIASK